MAHPDPKAVVLAGATGLVGRDCLRLLRKDPAVGRITVITRRPLPGTLLGGEGAQKIDERRVDFDQLRTHADVFRGDQIVCALGTTIKKAGSREQFRRVDYDYPLEIARLGIQQGVRHFLLVSATGANARSRFFYSRVKGDLEDAITGLPFRSISIVRPSLLLGDREEFRLGEDVAKRFGFLFPRAMKPIPAASVAAALLQLSRLDEPGTRVVDSVQLQPLADAYFQGAGRSSSTTAYAPK